jgi:hypothetical protein
MGNGRSSSGCIAAVQHIYFLPFQNTSSISKIKTISDNPNAIHVTQLKPYWTA